MDNLPAGSQGRRGPQCDRGGWRHIALLAALFTRLQPDRDGLCQIEGAVAQGRQAHHRITVGRHRPAARRILRRRVLPLPCPFRIRLNLSGKCSSVMTLPSAQSRQANIKARFSRNSTVRNSAPRVVRRIWVTGSPSSSRTSARWSGAGRRRSAHDGFRPARHPPRER